MEVGPCQAEGGRIERRGVLPVWTKALPVQIRPAIEALANPRQEGVVHGGVTERTLDAHGLEARPIRVEEPGDSHDRIELQQCKGHRRVVEIHLPGLDRVGGFLRYGGGVDLQAKPQSLLWREPGPVPPSFWPSI